MILRAALLIVSMMLVTSCAGPQTTQPAKRVTAKRVTPPTAPPSVSPPAPMPVASPPASAPSPGSLGIHAFGKWGSPGDGDRVGTLCKPEGAKGYLRNYKFMCPHKGVRRFKTCSGPVTCKRTGVAFARRLQWVITPQDRSARQCSACK